MTTVENAAAATKPSPLEVIIVAAAVPVPIVATEPVPVAATVPVPVVVAGHGPEAEARPDTFTGRPDPLGASPTIEQLKKERAELRGANGGRFTVEEPSDRGPYLTPPSPPIDRTFTVLVMLIALNTAKLCLILWILLTVLQVRDQYAVADSTRSTIVSSLTTLQHQLDQGIAQQQVLINRVDDALVRLREPPPPAR